LRKKLHGGRGHRHDCTSTIFEKDLCSKNGKKISDEVFHSYFLLDSLCAEFICEQDCEEVIEIHQGAGLQHYF